MRCRCDCGKVWEVDLNFIKLGKTKSCGCLREELKSKPRSHGMCSRRNKATEYKIWASMIQRCTNKNEESYRNYGGRGITVCDRWRKFENFFEDMGIRPSPKLTLDRINNDGNYEPGNCRWADNKTQVNNARSNRILEYNGIRLNAEGWSNKTGINKATIRSRLNYLKWDLQKTLTQPVRK